MLRGVGLRGAESLLRRRRGGQTRRVRTLRAELRRGRQLPTTPGARPSQRRGAFLAELGARLVLLLAPGTFHRTERSWRLSEDQGSPSPALLARTSDQNGAGRAPTPRGERFHPEHAAVQSDRGHHGGDEREPEGPGQREMGHADDEECRQHGATAWKPTNDGGDGVARQDQRQEPARHVDEVFAAVSEVTEAEHLRDEQRQRCRLVARDGVRGEERRGDDPVGREQPARTVEGPAAHRLAATQREESGHGAEERDAELALVEHEDVPGHGKVRHLEDVTEDDEEQRDAAQPVEADEAAATAGVGRHHVGASAAVGSVAGTSAAAAATASWRRIRRSTTIERKITTQKYFSYSALMKVPDTAKPTKPARSPSPHPASSSASGEP